MNDREAIAEIAGIYIDTLNRGNHVITRFEQGNRAAESVLAAGYRKPRTVTGTDELDALPLGSVVMSNTVFLRVRSARGRLVWGCVGSRDILDSSDVLRSTSAATVLHEGDAS